MQTEMLELSRYRAEKAHECLADSQAAFDEGRLATSINRSYYAMFHMTRALLALEGKLAFFEPLCYARQYITTSAQICSQSENSAMIKSISIAPITGYFIS